MTVPLKRVCGHCGADDVGTYAAGWSRAGRFLCHPNVTGRPDCYRLVTVFGHPFDCLCTDIPPMVKARS